MKIEALYHKDTYTLTYIVYDEKTKDGVIIDPVLDYDPNGSVISYKTPKQYVERIKQLGLTLHYILETHAHADHLTSAQFLKEQFPMARLAIGENITQVQAVFKNIFNLKDQHNDGRDFDLLLKDKAELKAGSLSIKVLNTPGHTPACVTYLINDTAIFTGDALFMEDYGTGRCDFPKGDARTLYHSVTERIYTLPEHVKVYPGHDYQPGGREVKWESTVKKEKMGNIQLRADTQEADFVKFRNERDAGLAAPRLLLQSVQFNAWGGKMPKAEDNNIAYFKMPLKIKATS